MDIYQEAIETLLKHPIVQNWPVMGTIIRKARANQPRPWRLPLIVCTAVGGAPKDALPAITAFACMQIGIILIDDLLDNDPRGVQVELGSAKTVNLAVAFHALGMEYLQSGIDAQLRGIQKLSNMLLVTAYGQELDTHKVTTEEEYWRNVRMKSSPFFGAAFYIGALSGGAPLELAEALFSLGNLYGEMIQIHDDLNDVFETPANPDWIEGRSPLPILFARLTDHSDQIRFLELEKEITKAENLAEAQKILISCGAVSYCVHQLFEKDKVARQLLTTISLKYPQELENLFDIVIRPVQTLYDAVV